MFSYIFSSISEKGVAKHTGVVNEMMKASKGFDIRWMTDLIDNIVKEGYIPDYLRKNSLVLFTLCLCSRLEIAEFPDGVHWSAPFI